MQAKKKKAAKTISKSDFIRSLGPDVSADEVISKAKAQGLDLTKKYVWTTQYEMRKEGKTTAKDAAAPAPRASKKAKPSTRGSKRKVKRAKPSASAAVVAKPTVKSAGGDAAQKMKALVLELGTTRADEIYRDVRAQVDAFIGRA